MRPNRWWILGDAATIRWDILHVTFSPSGNVIAEGGKASASAQNKSTITLTGGDYGIEGFVDYWNRAAPVPKVDGNRTLFHVLPTNED